MFSFYLSNHDLHHGSVMIGGYDLEKYAKSGTSEKDIMWHDLLHTKTEYFWTLGIQKVRLSGGKKMKNTHTNSKNSFMNVNAKDEIQLSTDQIVVDTGMSFGTAPQSDIHQIVEMLNANYGLQCEGLKNGDKISKYRCNCAEHKESELPTIQVYLKTGKGRAVGQFFDIKPQDYLSIKHDKSCNILLRPTQMKQWFIGDQFIQQFYTIYDVSKRQIGLIPSKN